MSKNFDDDLLPDDGVTEDPEPLPDLPPLTKQVRSWRSVERMRELRELRESLQDGFGDDDDLLKDLDD